MELEIVSLGYMNEARTFKSLHAFLSLTEVSEMISAVKRGEQYERRIYSNSDAVLTLTVDLGLRRGAAVDAWPLRDIDQRSEANGGEREAVSENLSTPARRRTRAESSARRPKSVV